MKLEILTIVLFCLLAVSKSAEEEYDYDDEPAPAPVTSAPTKPASRLSGLLVPRNRPVATKKASQVTSTTAKPVEHTEEYADGDEGLEEKQEDEAPITTTEASKKLKGGVVRPFRSNEDLLAALKRRRAQVGLNHAKEHSSTQPPAETPSSSKFKSSNSRSRNSGNAEVTSKPTSRGRFGSYRGSKPIQEDVEETRQDEVQVKPKSFRRG